MGDLNSLIVDQRDPLEQVQSNVETGAINVGSGTQELKKVREGK